MNERIMTMHPQGKQGVRIDRAKYDAIREAIIAVLREVGEATFGDLTAAVRGRLAGCFDGSVSWYVTTVKLDLEARGEIERVPGSRPQRLRLAAEE